MSCLILLQKIRTRKKMGKSKQGKLFEQITYNALKELQENSSGGFWFKRLYDYKTYVAVNPLIYCFKQPADYMACCAGHFYLIECKSSMANRFTIENLRPHQEEAMGIIEKAGGYYWLLIFHRIPETREHELYALSPKAWHALKKQTIATRYASAGWDEIRKVATFVLKKKGRFWDLAPLFNFHFPEEAFEAPVRFRKSRHMANLKKRDVQYILSKEFPAVAMYDPETDEVVIITDLWMKKCWTDWIRDFDKFITYLMFDITVSHVHELIHWATEPTQITGSEITEWEDKVEKVAKSLVLGQPDRFVLTIDV